MQQLIANAETADSGKAQLSGQWSVLMIVQSAGQIHYSTVSILYSGLELPVD